MNQSSISTATVKPESVWFDGAPASVSSDAVHADLMAFRKLVCRVCRKRGMKAIPQHTADGHYRVLCSCRTCRHVEAN